MQIFNIYVTNITEAITVLQKEHILARNAGTCIEVTIDPSKQTETIMLLNQHNVIVYDIEVAS